ncbi:hypothetical protein [Saprospira grandis]|uniref:TIGR02646 family protein n=1 Tax=Saprospira grandis (strain Lewin) TaxID=984262 RepID=H6L720_SAPGL|nr:hypothetical protein [Saprospira grandis]AFC26611.1 hypothetical protein SGRA_3895 [Saprospira grandis str. Lewin]
MKWIDKSKPTPADLKEWHDYQLSLGKLAADYADSNVKGADIYKYLDHSRERYLGDTEGYTKEALRKTLVEEQAYLCCYCGKQIELNHKTIIEHLYPKSKDKSKTFEYANLLASCDGGQHYKPFYTLKAADIKASYEETLNTLEEQLSLERDSLLALYVEIPVEEHEKWLKQLCDIENLKSGDQLFIARPSSVQPHCDDKKGGHIIPLDPTMKTIATYFEYLPSGKIQAANLADPIKEEAVKKTIDRLGLDAPLLEDGRERAFKEGKKWKRKLGLEYGRATPDYEKAVAFYVKKWNQPDAAGKLAPFVFVKIAALCS